jgi:hypothetical protein
MCFSYKYSLLFLFFLSLFITSSAQDAAIHKLYLKDGRIIEGVILEQKFGESIKIKLGDGEEVTFAENEVELLVREKASSSNSNLSYYQSTTVPPTRRMYRRSRPISFREDGSIYHKVIFGLGFGQSNWGGVTATPTIPGYIMGYRHNQYINVGVGTGLEPYEAGLMLPMFGEFSGDLGRQKKVQLHYFGQLGYGAVLSPGWQIIEMKGGIYSHYGAGYKINTRGRLDWTITCGFKSQKTWQRRQDWRFQGDIVGNRTYRRLVFQVAMGF